MKQGTSSLVAEINNEKIPVEFPTFAGNHSFIKHFLD
jgi:hypothetical protein